MANNGNGNGKKKIKKLWKWGKKQAGIGLTAKEEKERRKRRMKREKTRTAFAEEGAKRSKAIASLEKYRASARKSRSANGLRGGSAIGDWIAPSGFSGGAGGGGIYSPYNLGKERKRKITKRKRAKPKRRKKVKVYYEYR